MISIVRVAFVLLIGGLIGSIGFNLYLYSTALNYYLELNSTRLDPFGIDIFPSDTLSVVPKTNPSTIVFFGDSRAAGWLAPTEIQDSIFINRGISGQTSAQVLGRFQQHVASLQPNIVIVQVGINDLKTLPLFPDQEAIIIQNCKENIQAIVNLVLEAGAQEVILTTIFPLGKLPLERRLLWSDAIGVAIAEVNTFIRSLESEQVVVLDAEQVLTDSNGIMQPNYSQDFLHLNTGGYAALNRELVRLLGK